MPAIRVLCPNCNGALHVTSNELDQREASLSLREAELRRREEALRLREADRQEDVRLIRSCLHPDRHQDEFDRYNRALQAFHRLVPPHTKRLSEWRARWSRRPRRWYKRRSGTQ